MHAGNHKTVVKLGQARNRLRALPQLSPPESAWSGIQARLSQPTVRWHPRPMKAVVGLAAAFTALAIGLVLLRPAPLPVALHQIAAQAPVQTDAHDVWVVRSQYLDNLLQQMPQRRQVQRAGTAAAIDALQDRIQWVDYQLAYGNEAGLTTQQATHLWQDRVRLMDSLVKVRYAATSNIVY
jgi:hypothetical protein